MIKKITVPLLFFIFFCSLFLSPASGQTRVFGQSGPVWLTAADTDHLQPTLDVQTISDTSLQIHIRFPGIWVEAFKNEHGEYSRLFLEGYGQAAPLGAPDLPIFTTQVEIPAQAAAQLAAVDVKTKTIQLAEYNLPLSVLPMQRAASKSGPTPPWQPADESIYQHDQFLPSAYAKLTASFQMRDHHIVPIQIQPVRYQPTTRELELVEEISLTITWDSSAQPDVTLNNRGSRVFDDLVNNLVLNPSSTALDRKDPTGVGYLIITPQEFTETLAPFAALKEAEGYDVTVATLETIGSTNTLIKSYINTAYTTWTVPPTYLLLAGDTNYIPSWPTIQTPDCTSGYCFRKSTDLYYATITPDYVPDLLVGRLPAQNITELNIIVNKLLTYPASTPNADWVQKAAFIATADSTHYEIAENSHNSVINNHTLPRGYTGTFPTDPSPGGDQLYYRTHEARKVDLTAAINDERSLVVYSGHGSLTSWADFGFASSDIRSLDTDQVYPFVAGFACETNDIANAISTVFGETWLVTPNKGAIAYLGSADYSYWNQDDTFERHLFDEFYNQTGFTPPLANAVFAGLNAVQTQYPDFARYYWETYMLLGDPSQRILINPRTPFFEIFTYPNPLKICVGSPQVADLYTTAYNGFNDAVNLSTPELPIGLTVKFQKNPITPVENTLFTISANTGSPLGKSAISILGTSSSYQNTVGLNLFISNQKPPFPLLRSQVLSETGNAYYPILSWWKVDQAQTYQIQIASDPNFDTLILSDSITDYSDESAITYHSSLALESNAVYYWRVRGVNACGIGNYSSVWQFRTPAGPGDCPAGYAPQIDFFTDFETASPQWVSLNPYENNAWIRQTVLSQSPQYSYFATDIHQVSLTSLTSPIFHIPADSYYPTLQFWQWYDIEKSSTGCYDGGLLQYQVDQGQWTNISDLQLLPSTYDGKIYSHTNPINEQKAWCGNSEGWKKTVIPLNGLQGKDIQFQFQLGTDFSNIYEAQGWYIDDVRLQSCFPLDLKSTYLPLIYR